LALKVSAAMLLAILTVCKSAHAQQQVSYALLPSNTISPAPVITTAPVTTPSASTDRHRFWDRENTALFAANAAFSAADFVVTKDNLRSGGQELNPVTRAFSGSTTGLALNFVGENVGVAGLSFFFHKTGHHKLERAISMVNLGSSGAAIAFGMSHR
jgi:hypothetical protein